MVLSFYVVYVPSFAKRVFQHQIYQVAKARAVLYAVYKFYREYMLLEYCDVRNH